MITIFIINATILILMFVTMEYLPEDCFDFFMVGHHVNEEVDSNLKSFSIWFSALLKIIGLTLVTCSSSTDQEPFRIATSAVERWR